MSKDVDEDNLLSGLWPEWKIVELIGSGSYGKVYKAVREDISIKTFSAIKVISIPQNDSEILELRVEGYDDTEIKKYYQNITSKLVNEIKCLLSLKSATNIVKINDYKVVEKENIGCNIFLRMELLIPFNSYILDKRMTQAEIIKFGRDICRALECCNEHNIVHRDIKPDNILVSEHGEFKLGDFGIAKRMDDYTSTMSRQGISSYIAPEVFKGKKYNIQADIYSLGIVLYKLLNNNRLPFAGQADEEYGLSSDGNMRRLGGEKLPAPANTNKEVAAVILRACEYNPDKRYKDPAEFGKALEALQEKVKIITLPMTANNYDIGEKTQIANQTMFETKKSCISKKMLIIAIVVLVILFSGSVVFAMFANEKFIRSENRGDTGNNNTSNTVEIDESKSEVLDEETTNESVYESEKTAETETSTEGIVTEESESEELITEQPTTQEPTTEQTTTEEITTEEPTTQEPTTQQPTTQEPTTEEPTTQEPTTQQPTTQEPTTEEPTTEEPTTQEPTTEEPTTEKQNLYIIPVGCTYYDASANKVYPEGREINVIPENGDELRTADYIYIYDNLASEHDDEYLDTVSYTWRVTVKDKSKTSYEAIIDTIAGETVESMHATFDECVNLKNSPKIPDTVRDMCYTFRNCESLEIPPELPPNVKILNQTFYYCLSLKEIPEIPNGVTALINTFRDCFSLKYIPAIPDSVINMRDAFYKCYAIETVEKLPGSVKNLNATFNSCKALKKAPEIPYGVETMLSTFENCESLTEAPVIPNTVKSMSKTFCNCFNLEKIPVIPESVVNMYGTFWHCSSLKEVAPIPENVKRMEYTFYHCDSLTGEVIVNANPDYYSCCFKDTYNIILKGSSDMLDELEATKWD